MPMQTSVFSDLVNRAFDRAAEQASAEESDRIKVIIDGREVSIRTPYPSPEDWRDQVIYFPMVDRFNNPSAAQSFSPSMASTTPFREVRWRGCARNSVTSRRLAPARSR